MEIITAYLTAKVAAYVGGSIVVFIITWILKRIPNEKIAKKVESLFFGIGVFITLGLSKWKYTKGFWNSVIEVWLIDAIENIVGSAVNGLIKGLMSDNEIDQKNRA